MAELTDKQKMYPCCLKCSEPICQGEEYISNWIGCSHKKCNEK